MNTTVKAPWSSTSVGVRMDQCPIPDPRFHVLEDNEGRKRTFVVLDRLQFPHLSYKDRVYEIMDWIDDKKYGRLYQLQSLSTGKRTPTNFHASAFGVWQPISVPIT